MFQHIISKLNRSSLRPQANFANSHASRPHQSQPSSNFHQPKLYHHPNFQPHQAPRLNDGNGFRFRRNLDNDFHYPHDQFHSQDHARRDDDRRLYDAPPKWHPPRADEFKKVHQ
jgi:hypothetical protein